jgi:hypothetical protein
MKPDGELGAAARNERADRLRPVFRRRANRALRLVAVSTSLALGVAGCAAHERVGRPPTSEEIRRINEYAQGHGDLQVEYATLWPSCAAGSCGVKDGVNLPPEDLTEVVSCDARELAIRTETGQTLKLRLPVVAGVSARNRPRGAAVGAAAGFATGTILTLLFLALAESGAFRDPDPSAPKPSNPTAPEVGKLWLVLSLNMAAGMALWGYILGGRQSFDFDRAPADAGERRP